jgi:hypothetical protein
VGGWEGEGGRGVPCLWRHGCQPGPASRLLRPAVRAEHQGVGEELDDLLVEEAAVARAQHDDVLGRPLLDALKLLEDLVHAREVHRWVHHSRLWGEGRGALVADFLRLSIREHQRSVRIALHLRRRLLVGSTRAHAPSAPAYYIGVPAAAAAAHRSRSAQLQSQGRRPDGLLQHHSAQARAQQRSRHHTHDEMTARFA